MQSIVNAATDGLIYRRKGRDNLAKLQQQPVNQKNIWQIQKINYTSSFTSPAIVESCAFGDAFYSGGGEWDFWGADAMFGSSGNGDAMSAIDTSGCYDPFADMFGFGGFGGFGETCQQCQTRQRRIADSDYNSCLWNRGLVTDGGGVAGGAALGAGAGTLIEPVGGTLIGGIVGGLIGGIGGAASGYMSCNHDRDSQYLSAIDRCPVCSR